MLISLEIAPSWDLRHGQIIIVSSDVCRRCARFAGWHGPFSTTVSQSKKRLNGRASSQFACLACASTEIQYDFATRRQRATSIG
jgi:hypothetical protein